MKANALPDGTQALMTQLTLGEIMRLIEGTARWVDAETFHLPPLWYPEHARGALFYKQNWSAPQMNTNRQSGVAAHKSEGNVHANKALTQALGLRSGGRQGWSCCHIWGVNDPTYQEPNVVVQDRRFFSCVANMVLLPTPMKAFTDEMPDVKSMLRICAKNFFGWQCDHKSIMTENAKLEKWQTSDDYPESWPRQIGDSAPLGVMPINADIRQSAVRRWRNIQEDLERAGPHYPREEVRKALAYWKLDPENPLMST